MSSFKQQEIDSYTIHYDPENDLLINVTLYVCPPHFLLSLYCHDKDVKKGHTTLKAAAFKLSTNLPAQ